MPQGRALLAPGTPLPADGNGHLAQQRVEAIDVDHDALRMQPVYDAGGNDPGGWGGDFGGGGDFGSGFGGGDVGGSGDFGGGGGDF